MGKFLISIWWQGTDSCTKSVVLAMLFFFCFEFSLPVNNLLLLAKCGALLHGRSYWSDSARDPNKQDIQYDPPTYISLPSKRESRM